MFFSSSNFTCISPQELLTSKDSKEMARVTICELITRIEVSNHSVCMCHVLAACSF